MEKLDENKLAQIAASAGLHLGCAVGAFVLVAYQSGEPVSWARETFLELCAKLFDETAEQLGSGHG